MDFRHTWDGVRRRLGPSRSITAATNYHGRQVKLATLEYSTIRPPLKTMGLPCSGGAAWRTAHLICCAFDDAKRTLSSERQGPPSPDLSCAALRVRSRYDVRSIQVLNTKRCRKSSPHWVLYGRLSLSHLRGLPNGLEINKSSVSSTTSRR